MTTILLAKPLIDQKLSQLKKQCQQLKAQGVKPCMKVILVGHHPPSLIYTRNKKKKCEEVGIDCEILHYPEDITADNFTQQVMSITQDPNIHGCFIQLPVPAQLQSLDLAALIPPDKDVDGFHSTNIASLYHHQPENRYLQPCTPKGIINLLKFYNIPVKGKHAVVIGRSAIVGKPMALMLLNQDATVTLCHSRTPDIPQWTRQADLIISAVGKPQFLNRDFIGKNRPVVIDVGINRNTEGKLCGDADFESIKDLCSAITPVPGGVGPLTILSLVENLLKTCS